MDDSPLPTNLVDLQRSAHAAWDELERHRREVDAARERESDPRDKNLPSWASRTLRPWTDAEDERHLVLRAAALDAQQALRQASIDAGLKQDADTVAQLHKLARGSGE
jgi:hypothetical protein